MKFSLLDFNSIFKVRNAIYNNVKSISIDVLLSIHRLVFRYRFLAIDHAGSIVELTISLQVSLLAVFGS